MRVRISLAGVDSNIATGFFGNWAPGFSTSACFRIASIARRVACDASSSESAITLPSSSFVFEFLPAISPHHLWVPHFDLLGFGPLFLFSSGLKNVYEGCIGAIAVVF